MSTNNDRSVRLWKHADGEWLEAESPRNMFAEPYIALPLPADDDAVAWAVVCPDGHYVALVTRRESAEASLAYWRRRDRSRADLYRVVALVPREGV